jgi:NAD(P)-dependent dehydrogenase (short-subunit alcohol dehydrogenase family)
LYGEGAKVAIGRRMTNLLQDVAKSCRDVHPSPTSPGDSDIIEFECDVTARLSVEAFYDAMTKHYHNSPMNSLVC